MASVCAACSVSLKSRQFPQLLSLSNVPPTRSSFPLLQMSPRPLSLFFPFLPHPSMKGVTLVTPRTVLAGFLPAFTFQSSLWCWLLPMPRSVPLPVAPVSPVTAVTQRSRPAWSRPSPRWRQRAHAQLLVPTLGILQFTKLRGFCFSPLSKSNAESV